MEQVHKKLTTAPDGTPLSVPQLLYFKNGRYMLRFAGGAAIAVHYVSRNRVARLVNHLSKASGLNSLGEEEDLSEIASTNPRAIIVMKDFNSGRYQDQLERDPEMVAVAKQAQLAKVPMIIMLIISGYSQGAPLKVNVGGITAPVIELYVKPSFDSVKEIDPDRLAGTGRALRNAVGRLGIPINCSMCPVTYSNMTGCEKCEKPYCSVACQHKDWFSAHHYECGS